VEKRVLIGNVAFRRRSKTSFGRKKIGKGVKWSESYSAEYYSRED
jgi:hypothetical protein